MYPTLHDIQYLASEAKLYASDEIKTENTEIFHTGYEMEDEQQRKNAIAKQHLQKLLSSQYYNQERFVQQQHIISDSLEDHMYQDLMIFACL